MLIEAGQHIMECNENTKLIFASLAVSPLIKVGLLGRCCCCRWRWRSMLRCSCQRLFRGMCPPPLATPQIPLTHPSPHSSSHADTEQVLMREFDWL